MVAIVVIVAGIMLGVLARTRRSAQGTDDVAKLRQIGMAAALYQEAHGEWPARTDQLVVSGFIPKDLCASRRDPTTEGLSNLTKRTLRIGPSISPRTSYKSSFIGAGDFGVQDLGLYRTFVLPSDSGGWLIDICDSGRATHGQPAGWTGAYTRLLFSGSIVRRMHRKVPCKDDKGRTGPCTLSVAFFCDPSDELIQAAY